MPEERAGAGWFAYTTALSEDDYVDPPVRDVHLRVDEYGGPFWYSEGCLGDDYDELADSIGLSRPLYDAVMTWHGAALEAGEDDPATYRQQQDLLRRLAEEVGDDVTVPAPRREPPTKISILREPLAEVASRKGITIPADLLTRVAAWRSAAKQHAYATGDNDAAIWAWEDEGLALADEVRAVLGDDYVVSSR